MSARKYLLVCTLMLALVVTACGPKASPTSVPTPVPPTSTPVPPTKAPDVVLDAEQRVAEGGFSFQPPKGYMLQPQGSVIFLSAPDASSDYGPVIVMGGGETAGGLIQGATSLEDAFEKAKTGISGETMTIVGPTEIKVGGARALSGDLSGKKNDTPMAGRLIVAMPGEKQIFAMAVASPKDKWDAGVSKLVEAMLSTVKFFPPVVPTEGPGTVVPGPPQPTVPPTPAGGGGLTEIRQWATEAAAGSEYDSPSWGAIQATGAPNITTCSDNSLAWASSGSDSRDWLALTYAVPVYVTQINIYETYNPDTVVKVELIDANSRYHEVYTGEPKQQDCPYVLRIDVPQTDYQAVGVRINIDQSVLGLGWNEIDAVELVGMGDATAVPPTPAPLGGKPPEGFIWRLDSQGNDLFYAGAGLAIGQDGNIYFVDALAQYHVISPDGEILNTVQDYDHLSVASDIDVGPDGDLYIASWGSDGSPISVYTPDGTFVRGWGAKGTGDGQFGDYSPEYLAICNNEVYAVDGNKDADGNDLERVQVFDLDGNYLRQWSITAQEEMFSAKGIACGPGGDLYLVGFLSDKILSFSPAGDFQGEVGNSPLAGFTVGSLAMDVDGNFYIGTWDSGVVKLDPDGQKMADWGTSTDEQGPRAEGVFHFPDAIAVDSDGHVYVADWSGDQSYMTKFIFP